MHIRRRFCKTHLWDSDDTKWCPQCDDPENPKDINEIVVTNSSDDIDNTDETKILIDTVNTYGKG